MIGIRPFDDEYAADSRNSRDKEQGIFECLEARRIVDGVERPLSARHCGAVDDRHCNGGADKEEHAYCAEAHLAEGANIETVKELVAAETWLNGEEAAKYFNITVSEAKTYAAQLAGDVMNQYRNTPKEIIKPAQAVNDNTADKTAQKIKSLVIQGISKGV